MKDKAMHIGLVIINYMILYRLFQWFTIGISNHKTVYPVFVLFAPLVIVLPLSLIISAKMIEHIKQWTS